MIYFNLSEWSLTTLQGTLRSFSQCYHLHIQTIYMRTPSFGRLSEFRAAHSYPLWGRKCNQITLMFPLMSFTLTLSNSSRAAVEPQLSWNDNVGIICFAVCSLVCLIWCLCLLAAAPRIPRSLLSSCYCKSEHNVLLGIFIEPDERLKGPEGPKALDKQFIWVIISVSMAASQQVPFSGRLGASLK